MSSHREAPEISKDPVADNADVYAFVSPDDPSTVTIISNFVPLQGPAGGPNFYEFGDDVLYSIYIDNDGDAMPEIEYQFQFTSSLQNPNTFLYNTGPIALARPTRTGTRARSTRSSGSTRAEPPKHGPAAAARAPTSKPGPALQPGPDPLDGARLEPRRARRATSGRARRRTTRRTSAPRPCRACRTGEKVFCGQRSDPFYVDLGSIFDLGGLRPFNAAHLIPLATSRRASTATKALNIHTIAIQIPISMLTRDGSPPTERRRARPRCSAIWSAASRRRVADVRRPQEQHVSSRARGCRSRASATRSSTRSIVPLGQKDDWNRGNPVDDAEYLPNVQHPELAGLLPVLYPTRRRVPEPGGAHGGPGRPGGDPAHRDPGRRHPSRRRSRTTPARRTPTCCG